MTTGNLHIYMASIFVTEPTKSYNCALNNTGRKSLHIFLFTIIICEIFTLDIELFQNNEFLFMIDPCSNGPCGNNGECDDYIDSYNCKCQPDFNGIKLRDTDRSIVLESSATTMEHV